MTPDRVHCCHGENGTDGSYGINSGGSSIAVGSSSNRSETPGLGGETGPL